MTIKQFFQHNRFWGLVTVGSFLPKHKTNQSKTIIFEKLILLAMKKIFFLFVLLAVVSCGGKDNPASGDGGWYALPFYTSSTYSDADEFDRQHIDEFFYSDGRYGQSVVSNPGSEYELVSNGPAWYRDEIDVIHIESGNRVAYYTGFMYRTGSSGAKSRTLLYALSGGVMGNVGFYASSPSYYSYTKDGNKMVFTQGSEKIILTLSGNSLTDDDGNQWTKFDPSKTY